MDNIITIEQLFNHGLNIYDINVLLEYRIIRENHPNLFELISLDKLIVSNYFYRLLPLITIYFNHNHSKINILLNSLINGINDDNKMVICSYMDILLSLDNNPYSINIMMILYLLCVNNNDLPKKYYNCLKQFKVNSEFSQHNLDLYKTIVNHKYAKAIKTIIDRYSSSYQDMGLIYLLEQATNNELVDRNNVLNLIENEQYKEIIRYYSRLSNQYPLSTIPTYVIKLCDMIGYINKFGFIPKVYRYDSKNIFDAINNHDFKLALSFASSYTKENCSKDLLYLLLVKLNALIDHKKAKDFILIELDYFGLINIYRCICNHNLKKLNDYLYPYLVHNNKVDYLPEIKAKIFEYMVDGSISQMDLLYFIINIVTGNYFEINVDDIVDADLSNPLLDDLAYQCKIDA